MKEETVMDKSLLGNAIDLTGHRYGKLVVKERSHRKPKRCYWLCYCDCGKECIVEMQHLKSGHTKSCGCLFIDVITTHGKSKTLAHKSWENMTNKMA